MFPQKFERVFKTPISIGKLRVDQQGVHKPLFHS